MGKVSSDDLVRLRCASPKYVDSATHTGYEPKSFTDVCFKQYILIVNSTPLEYGESFALCINTHESHTLWALLSACVLLVLALGLVNPEWIEKD